MTWSIELATAADVARMTALANRAAEVGTANFATEAEPVADWQRLYESTATRYPWLVARAGGEVVGFAKAGPHKARGAYRFTAEMTIYLDDRWQGRGLGHALYQVLIPMLRAQGFRTLLAGITSGHVASERLHRRHGFEHCATFHRVGWKLGAWHDVSYWELWLGDPAASAPAETLPVAALTGSVDLP